MRDPWRNDREDQRQNGHVQQPLEAGGGQHFDKRQVAPPGEHDDADGFTDTKRQDVVGQKADAVRPERLGRGDTAPQQLPPDFAAHDVERKADEGIGEQPPQRGSRDG